MAYGSSDQPDRPPAAVLGDDQRDAGPMLMDVTNAVVAACKEHAGKGPPRAKAYAAPDTVYVVLGDWMTRAERTLMGQGSEDLVAEMRSTLHDRIGDATRTAVEAATGRTVVAVQTQVELARNVATVRFTLGPAGE